MSKRYKLLKDLPDYKAGEIFTYTGAMHYKAEHPCTEQEYGQWPIKYVENNPEWFELINDRIEVKGIGVFQTEGYGKDCHFYTTGDVPKEKVPLIKQAIERVLNGDDECYFDADRLNAQRDKLQAMELAFNAARSGISHSQRHAQHLLSMVLYKTFQDYLNSLTQQNKDQ